MEDTCSQALQMVVALGGSKAKDAWAWAQAAETYGVPCAGASLDAMAGAAMGMASGDVLVDALPDMGHVLVDAAGNASVVVVAVAPRCRALGTKVLAFGRGLPPFRLSNLHAIHPV